MKKWFMSGADFLKFCVSMCVYMYAWIPAFMYVGICQCHANARHARINSQK